MSDEPTFPPVDESAWRARVAAELGDADFAETLVTELADGLEVQPLYVAHGEDWRQPRRPRPELGWCPAARGDAPDPEALNGELRAALDGGAGAVWLRFDRASRAGLDADDPAAGSLAGRDGLAAYTLADLEAVLHGVALDSVPLLVEAGGNALPAAALVLGLAQKQGVDCGGVEAHWGCDPLGSLAADGRAPAALADLRVEMRQLASFCDAALPAATAVAVSDLPYHGAGASAGEELGITAATLVTYLRWMDAEGMEPATALDRILLRAAVGRDVFLAVAKLRALRVLWRKVAGACGIAEPPAARLHAVTSRRPLTARDPWSNMLRATTQAFAAVVGGADWVTTVAWDETLGPPAPAARRLARNTQVILGEEAGLGAVLDPAGGAHYVEQLTEDLARSAWAFLQEIERAGGAEPALTGGWLAARLRRSREARHDAIRAGRHPILGVTHFADDAEEVPVRAAADPAAEARRAAARLQAQRAARGQTPDLELASALDRMAVWVKMASQGATLGELSVALRRGAAATSTPLPRHRDEEAAATP